MPGDLGDPRLRQDFAAAAGRRIVAADYRQVHGTAIRSLAVARRYDAWRVRRWRSEYKRAHLVPHARKANSRGEAAEEVRRAAKPLNFGSIYGMAARGLIKSAFGTTTPCL